MKTVCYCFILSLTLVSFFLFAAVDCSVFPDPYTKEVRLNNFAFENCQGKIMADLIRKFVCKEVPMEDISYIFAVPEKANRLSQYCIDRETATRQQLSSLMTIPVPIFNEVPDMTLLPGLGTKRRGIVRNAMQTVINGFSEEESMDKNLCRSLGLLRSVLDPESFINSFLIEVGTCIVISTIKGIVKSSKYKYVGGVILQVQINDTNRTEPLSYEKAW
ncbi:uncharacterized protein LOC126833891 [Adelges cooleyi]|uniref:uncharacterized protein LOC126833891 n=1 Tax=Adelges cooleyi TaxID=133065 RepID=UPI00217F9E6E|nr:uncharacterized protein LOC126833891 [Adelges cooleyi]